MATRKRAPRKAPSKSRKARSDKGTQRVVTRLKNEAKYFMEQEENVYGKTTDYDNYKSLYKGLDRLDARLKTRNDKGK